MIGEPATTRRRLAVGSLRAALLVVLWLGGWAAYRAADRAGYVRHTAETQVMARDDWQVGEYKFCGVPLHNGVPNSAFPQGVHLNCTDQDAVPIRTFKVYYWGRIWRAEKGGNVTIGWRCERRPESVTCWARN